MKTKILLVLLSLGLCLTLFACTANNPAETTPAVTTGETSPEMTPEVTPEATPEATPEVTPEATPEATPETTLTEIEPDGEPLTAEQIDAICKEKFDFIDRKYVGKITCLGSIDAGQVFIAYATPNSTWGMAMSLKVGSYMFNGYGDYANDRGIYIYNGESIREINAVYNVGEISEEELANIYAWWREYRVIQKFEEDYADQYKLVSVERVLEFESASLYLLNVSKKTASEGAELTVGKYEFDGYGEDALLYIYKDLPFGSTAANEVDDSCNMGYTSGKELALIHEYWADNFGGK